MLVRVVLLDINPKMIQAWKQSFEENPEVEIVQGSMLDRTEIAWVTPTNSRGSMDGGLDAVLKRFLGTKIENRVQAEIKRLYGGVMPVGAATCVETGRDLPRFLISTPTMAGSSDDVSNTLNVALACGAAFQAVHIRNRQEGGVIRSVALPGLGAATGRVPVEICADLIWTAYNLFRENEFETFSEMRAAIEKELGSTGSFGSVLAAKKKGTAKETPSVQTVKAKSPGSVPGQKGEFDPDEDFDDHE